MEILNLHTETSTLCMYSNWPMRKKNGIKNKTYNDVHTEYIRSMLRVRKRCFVWKRKVCDVLTMGLHQKGERGKNVQ